MALSRITEAVASFTDLTIGDDLTLTDDLLLASDAALIKFGADGDVIFTHVADTGLLLNSTSVIQFNDASQSIGAPNATTLDINATDEIELNATLCDVNANLDVSGSIVGAGTILGTIISASTAFVPDSTDGAALGTTALEFSDLFLADGAVINLGADQDIKITHVADTGVLLNAASVIQFRDSAINIGSPADGDLDINADDEIELNSTLIDVNGNLDVSGTGVIAGAVTTAALTASGIIKTDDTTAATSTTDGSLQTDGGLSVAADAVIGDDLLLLSDAAVLNFGADSEIKLTHVHNTGLLLTDSGGTPTLQFHDANESISSDGGHLIFTSNGVTFDLPSADGDDGQALVTNGSGVLSFAAAGSSNPSSADGQALGSASLEWSDLFLADAGTIQFGNDQDVILTHVADTGLLLSGTNVIQFNDASQNIGAPSNAILDINATDEIELNSTLVDLNGNLDVSGTIVGASTLSATTGTFSGVLKTDDTTNATSTTDGSLQTDGGLSVALDVVIGDDLFLLSDSAVLNIGADSDLKITHDGTNGDFESAGNLTFDVAGGIILDGAGDITLDSAFDIILDADANDVIFKDAGTEHFRITNSGTSTVTLDAVGDITLDAGGGDVNFADDGTAFAFVAVSGNNAIFGNPVSDGKIFIQGSDGGDQQVYIEIDPAVGEGAIGFHANGSLAMNPIGITMSNQASGGTFSYNTDASSLEFSTFRNNGTQKGSIVTTANATSYNTSSDYRLKQNVDYDWDATTECKKLKPCQFKWIDDVTIEDGGGATAPIITGFLAHELQAVVPDAAFGVKDATETYINDDGDSATRIKPQGIDQAKIIAILTKTILELEARITALE